MKKCVCCGRETYHRFELYVVCYQCEIDGSFDNYLKEGIAAQQSAQPDGAQPWDLCPKCGDPYAYHALLCDYRPAANTPRWAFPCSTS